MFVNGVVFCILFAHVHLGRMCWSVCVEACVLDIVTLFGMVGLRPYLYSFGLDGI